MSLLDLVTGASILFALAAFVVLALLVAPRRPITLDLRGDPPLAARPPRRDAGEDGDGGRRAA